MSGALRCSLYREELRILEPYLISPISSTFIVPMQADLPVSIQCRSGLIGRSILDRLTVQIDRYHVLGPAHALDPSWRDEHLVSEPPIAGIYDEVSNRPGFIVEEQSLDVTDSPIARLDVIFDHRLAAAPTRDGCYTRKTRRLT